MLFLDTSKYDKNDKIKSRSVMFIIDNDLKMLCFCCLRSKISNISRKNHLNLKQLRKELWSPRNINLFIDYTTVIIIYSFYQKYISTELWSIYYFHTSHFHSFIFSLMFLKYAIKHSSTQSFRTRVNSPV